MIILHLYNSRCTILHLLPLLALILSMAGGSCIGDGTPCPCISYEEEVIGDRRRCYECHHGKSRHCSIPPAIQAGNSYPRTITEHHSGFLSDTLPSSRGSMGGVVVNSMSMLQQLVRQPQTSPTASGSNLVSKQDARAEALQGFRPKSEVSFFSRIIGLRISVLTLPLFRMSTRIPEGSRASQQGRIR
jgi:hypothetical protein